MWKLRERKARLCAELLAVLRDRRRRGRERGDGSGINSIAFGELKCLEFKDRTRARRRRRTGMRRLLECRALDLLLFAVRLLAWRRPRALLLVVLTPGAGLWSPELGLRG